VGRRGDLAGLIHLGQGLVDDLHVEVRRRETEAVAICREQDIGQDRNRIAALHGALHMSQRLQQRRAFNGQLHCVVRNLKPPASDSSPARSSEGTCDFSEFRSSRKSANRRISA